MQIGTINVRKTHKSDVKAKYMWDTFIVFYVENDVFTPTSTYHLQCNCFKFSSSNILLQLMLGGESKVTILFSLLQREIHST